MDDLKQSIDIAINAENIEVKAEDIDMNTQSQMEVDKDKNLDSQEPMTFYPTLEQWSDLPRSVENMINDVFL